MRFPWRKILSWLTEREAPIVAPDGHVHRWEPKGKAVVLDGGFPVIRRRCLHLGCEMVSDLPLR